MEKFGKRKNAGFIRVIFLSSFEEITTDKPEKSLLEELKKTGGRNMHGRLTVRHQGGGHKRLYRIIDFKRNNEIRRL